MNVYRNKLTGAIIEIPSEMGSDKVWENITPAPVPEGVAEPKEEVEKTPKKTRKTVKK